MGTWDHLQPWDDQIRAALAVKDVQRAFASLVEGYQHAVVGFCIQMLQDEDHGKEVAQEIFVQAYDALRRYQQKATVRTWLFSIARKQCWKAMHQARRQRHRPETGPPDPQSSIEDLYLAAETEALAEQQRLWLQHCLTQLLKRERDLIMMYYYAETPVAQIAGRMTSATTIRRKLRAIEQRLKQCITRGITGHDT